VVQAVAVATLLMVALHKQVGLALLIKVLQVVMVQLTQNHIKALVAVVLVLLAKM